MQGQLTMQMKIKLRRGGGGGKLPYERGEDARRLA